VRTRLKLKRGCGKYLSSIMSLRRFQSMKGISQSVPAAHTLTLENGRIKVEALLASQLQDARTSAEC